MIHLPVYLPSGDSKSPDGSITFPITSSPIFFNQPGFYLHQSNPIKPTITSVLSIAATLVLSAASYLTRFFIINAHFTVQPLYICISTFIYIIVHFDHRRIYNQYTDFSKQSTYTKYLPKVNAVTRRALKKCLPCYITQVVSTDSG